MAFDIDVPADRATIGRTTVGGWPFLGAGNYLTVIPEYTQALIEKLVNADADVAAAVNAAANAQAAAAQIGRGARRHRTTPQVTPNGGAQIAFDAVTYNDGGHTLNANGSVTIGLAGRYRLAAGVMFDEPTGATGQREIQLLVNGTRVTSVAANATNYWSATCSTTLNLAVGDIVAATAWHNAGGNRSLAAAATFLEVIGQGPR